MEPESLAFLAHVEEQCEVLVHWMQRHIIDGLNNEVVIVPPPILSRVFQELSRGLVNAQNVRKIAEVPFPFPYTQMSIVMLLSSTVLTPVLAAITSSTSWEAAFLAFMPVLTFWCLNYMAAEIEQPFGEDANDLPLPEMVAAMNNSLRRLIDPQTQNLPRFNYVPEAHSTCPTRTWGEHCNPDLNFAAVWSCATLASTASDRRYDADFAKRRRHKLPPAMQQVAAQMRQSPSGRRGSDHGIVTPVTRTPSASLPMERMVAPSPPPPREPADVLPMSMLDPGYTARGRRMAGPETAAGVATSRTGLDGSQSAPLTAPPPLQGRPPESRGRSGSRGEERRNQGSKESNGVQGAERENGIHPPGLISGTEDDPRGLEWLTANAILSVVPSQIGSRR
uniref:Uncharacterized protein n=1 Tax=Alexandrium catenella TaxID=2925 RepID=A0A7S1WDC1_ALECA